MLRIAIIGCGKVADDHLSQIQRIQGCEVVAACDKEPLMARQLAERFGIPRCYTNAAEMLEEARPNVAHITTPPQSHYDLARQCLEHGTHVYVEKPFAVDATEAERLIGLAETNRLKVTVGHDEQYSHASRRMRALIQEGYLGGRPVHMESDYCYDLSDPSYARALFSNREHWVRQLRGRLLHNVISHGIAKVAEFLPTETPHVIAHGFVSPLLRTLGDDEIVDELRVIISDKKSTTAYFTFSSQMRPSLHHFRIYGSKNGLSLDVRQQTLLRLRGARFKSYAERFIPPVDFAMQHLGNLATNAKKFLKNDFHMKSGMKHLIESFYRSVAEGTSPPIPYREIVLTARIMDAIFDQLAGTRSSSQVSLLQGSAMTPLQAAAPSGNARQASCGPAPSVHAPAGSKP